MYSKELIEKLTKILAPSGYDKRQDSEARYPARSLPDGAIVTRSAPSPTGFVHIGTIYMSLINKLVSLQTQGVNMLRIEDTDKKREIVDGIKTIVNGLGVFDLRADEGVEADSTSYGDYGPYLQSQRDKIYLGFAIDLLEKGRAYPCFATAEELDENYKDQQANKVRPGYYGKWAVWRDRSEEDVLAALEAGKPFVLRFKSNGSHEKRIKFKDVLKGSLELPENDLDVPLIKNDEWRLPTYHLAHVVDDFLMGTTTILRGDEWLPSTPLHIELAEALGIKPFSYAHFAPISIIDKGNKRKLSKRKDPEADVSFFIAAGYPIMAILEYLIRLANSNFEDWRNENPAKPIWEFPFSFEKWAKARGALLDLQKLDDVSKNIIAGWPQADYEQAVRAWAEQFQPIFYSALKADPEYTSKVLAVERTGEQKRKDVAKIVDTPSQYGYFFDDLYNSIFAVEAAIQLEDFETSVVADACKAFLDSYNQADDQQTWFDKLKAAAEATDFATDNKAFKENPSNFKGNVADFARIIRVKLTGKNRTPDLWTIMKVMGPERVKNRLSL